MNEIKPTNRPDAEFELAVCKIEQEAGEFVSTSASLSICCSPSFVAQISPFSLLEIEETVPFFHEPLPPPAVVVVVGIVLDFGGELKFFFGEDKFSNKIKKSKEFFAFSAGLISGRRRFEF